MRARRSERRPLPPSVIVTLGIMRAFVLALLGGFYFWMAGFIDGSGGRAVDWLGAAIVAALFGLATIIAIARTFHCARKAALARASISRPESL